MLLIREISAGLAKSQSRKKEKATLPLGLYKILNVTYGLISDSPFWPVHVNLAEAGRELDPTRLFFLCIMSPKLWTIVITLNRA